MRVFYSNLPALLFVFLSTTAAAAQGPHRLPVEGPSLNEVGLPGALDLAIAYELPPPTAVQVLMAAAESGDRSLVPRLKAILAAYPESDIFGFLALHALRELGEMHGDAEWAGIVIVRGSAAQEADHELSGTPRIVGGLVVLPGADGSGSVSLRGEVSVRYSPEALRVARAAVGRQP